MNEVLLISIMFLLFLTYKFLSIVRNKEGTEGNRRIAWLLYSVAVVTIITVNVFLY
ncbi:hypothetical protein RYX56_00600 [Alkalihalophilus lindianensis]|uniref:Uncharacterized protein n=1 Tax=Alkalihalophilus lindianensis TaxID=1630542 RepID=A0ABU3X6H9_9BACI|nr:hypothetical protein [Alkalihalophilus lindianensis]MDV2682863.1 hypothetical protein [Alkalihalophilus lindianensis]